MNEYIYLPQLGQLHREIKQQVKTEDFDTWKIKHLATVIAMKQMSLDKKSVFNKDFIQILLNIFQLKK